MTIVSPDQQPRPIPGLATQAEKRTAELERDLSITRAIEDSLRRENAALRENDACWAKRLQALENRQKLMNAIAAGRLPDDVIATLLEGFGQ